MAYIGQQPVVGRYILLDQISGGFNGTTSGFTMSTAGGVQGVKPGLAQNVLLSLGGVIQQPGVDYTISGSGITFTTPPVAGTTFFATVLGDAQSVGTPSDGTVTPASIAAGYDFAFPNVNVTGVTTIASGVAATPSLSITGDSNTGLLSPAANTLAVSTDGTERLRVDSSGSVLVGTTDSTIYNNGDSDSEGIVLRDGEVVDIARKGDLQLTLNRQTNDGHHIGFFRSGSPKSYISTRSDGFCIDVNSSERLRIDSSGRVGIGTTSPSNLLHISGSSAAQWIQFDGSQSNLLIGQNTGTSHFGQTNATKLMANNASNPFVIGNNQAQPLILGTSSAERMRIDSSGRLLVGATSSTNLIRLGQAFAVSTTSDFGGGSFTGFNGTTANEGPILDLQRSRGTSTVGTVVASGDRLGSLVFRGDDGTDFADAAFMLGEVDGTPSGGFVPGRFAFYTGTTSAAPVERLRIDSYGRQTLASAGSSAFASVGYGWHVRSTNYYTAAIEYEDTAAAGEPLNIFHRATSGNNNFILFKTGASGTTRGSINYNRSGGLTAYNTTSDYRAKTLLGDVENPGETLDALKVYRGVMNGATVERPMLVAHEAQEVVPYCVTGEKDAVNDDGEPIYQQMDHQALVPLLIAEIQQLRARVAALESA